MNAPSLLPRNASQLEHLAAQGLSQIQHVPIPLRQLYNPNTCPVELLPYLAWAFSVDRWDSKWSEVAKRAAIRAAYFIHSRKGTIGALRRVIEPLGYLINVSEWWEVSPPETPGTFKLEVGVLDTGITEEMYRELSALIDDAKPLTRHLTGLVISLGSSGIVHIGACLYEGDETDVYPPAQHAIEVTGVIGVSGVSGVSGCEHSIDTLDVYP